MPSPRGQRQPVGGEVGRELRGILPAFVRRQVDAGDGVIEKTTPAMAIAPAPGVVTTPVAGAPGVVGSVTLCRSSGCRWCRGRCSGRRPTPGRRRRRHRRARGPRRPARRPRGRANVLFTGFSIAGGGRGVVGVRDVVQVHGPLRIMGGSGSWRAGGPSVAGMPDTGGEREGEDDPVGDQHGVAARAARERQDDGRHVVVDEPVHDGLTARGSGDVGRRDPGSRWRRRVARGAGDGRPGGSRRRSAPRPRCTRAPGAPRRCSRRFRPTRTPRRCAIRPAGSAGAGDRGSP